MNIAFRVDSSSEIGLGHISRCITLADELKKKKCKIFFICKEIENYSKAILNKKKIKLNIIKNNIPDSKETLKIVNRNKIDLIFLDHYHLDLKWEKEVIKKTKLAFIDDFYKRRSVADYYINYHGFLYGKKLIKLKPQCKKLIGFEFSILKKINIKKKKQNKNIFIYFGAVDKKKNSLKFLKILNNKNIEKFKFKFFVNENFKINKIFSKKNIFLYKKKNKNILSQMFNSKKIITQAGVSLYEALSTGNEVICIPTTKFQKNITKHLAKFCNFFTLNNINKIPFFLNKKIDTKFNKDILDGFGAERIANLIVEKKVEPKLKKLEKKDHLSLYNLRTDFITQRNSIIQKKFDFNAHRKFLRKSFNKSYWFTYKFKKNFIGHVRLDKKGNCYEIDYGISSPYRSKGLSLKILKKTLNQKNFLNKNFFAKVKKTNKYSNRNFKKMGFSLIHQQGKFNIFKKNA